MQKKIKWIGYSYFELDKLNYQIKLFWFIIFSKQEYGFWIRFFGVGFSVTNPKGELTFSERMGINSVKILGYSIKYLRK